jgi:N-acetylglucosamine-6-phosphate deacetylase
VLGLHIEGPWINPVKRGAHIEELIHAPSVEQVRALLEYGKGVIRIITLAPEVVSPEIIQLIRSYGIVISAGHSNATYAQAKTGFASGIRAVTHLYNAMSPLLHREPGLVGASMDDEQVMASIIPDGHHVDYAAIRIAKAVMKERLFVITDAVTDTDEGQYPHHAWGINMNPAVFSAARPSRCMRPCSTWSVMYRWIRVKRSACAVFTQPG